MTEKERYSRWASNNKDHLKEYHRQYYLEHQEKLCARAKKYAEDNRNKVLENKRNYYSTNKESILEKGKEYYKTHKEQHQATAKKYYLENKGEILSKNRVYRETKMGRAGSLRYQYTRRDKRLNLGKCTLTTRWILENIFSQPCIYCGETDWHQLGCDRIDNTKPHTPENVVCSCYKCNTKRGARKFLEFGLSFDVKESDSLLIAYPL